MEEYKKVDIVNYVKEGLEKGLLIPFKAEKYARIIAREGIVGENIISWSVDEFGNEVKEKEDIVTIDEKTNKPGWVVTKVDENGNILIDHNNHSNEWIISDSVFNDKYEAIINNSNVFKPKGKEQIFVQINENIILNQWGLDMKISSGGYINITNVNDMYGISERDFNDTYKVINELENNRPKL